MQVFTLDENMPPCLRERVKKRGAEHVVPANRAFGIRIVDVASNSSRVVLTLPVRRRS